MAQEVAIDILINTDLAGKSLKELKNFISESNTELKNLEQGSKEFEALSNKIDQANGSFKDILLNSQLTGKSLTELKEFIKAGNDELAKLAIGSKEYTELASRIGEAKDTVNELRETTALAAEGAFTAIADVGSKIASGFQVASGAMALFGNDSKDLQKTLAQVQGAMAMAQGIKQLEDLGRTFKNLKTTVLDFGKNVVSTLQKMYATMLANPITALVVAVAALAAGIIYLMNAEDDETEALKENIKQRDKAISKMQEEGMVADKQAKYRLDLMKAQGATEKEMFNASRDISVEKINRLNKENEAQRKSIENYNKLIKEASGDEKSELIKAHNEKIALINKNNTQIFDLTTEVNIKAAELRKKDADDAKEKAKEAAERGKQNAEKAKQEAEKQRQLQEELNKALANLRVENIKDEEKRAFEKLQLDYETQRKEYETKFKGKKELQDLLLQLDTKYLGDNIALQNKFDDEKKAKEEERKKAELEKAKEDAAKLREQKLADLEADIAETKLKNEERGKLTIEQEILFETQKYEILKSNKELTNEELRKLEADHLLTIANLADENRKNEEQKDKEAAERKKQLIQQGLDAAKGGLQATADLVNAFAGKSKAEQKKAFDFQKGVNIATATIDTYKAATAAFASAGNPIVGAIFAAIAVAAGIANIAKISSTQFEDKSGPSSSAASGPGASMGAFNPSLGAPVSNTSTNLASIGFNNSNEQPQVKVFVAETDISNTQNKVKSIEQKASIE